MNITINDILIIIIVSAISFMFLGLYGFLKNVYVKSLSKKPVPLSNLSVYVVNNEDDCRKACSIILEQCNELGALGFDCEWVTEVNEGKSLRRPVSLLQLSSHTGLCCLFRFCFFNIPTELKAILENKQILKVGVNCGYDAELVRKDYGIQVEHWLDLRCLYPTEKSLASLAKNILGIHLSKDKDLVCSNWNETNLSTEQINYAAKDAWVAIEIFKTWLRTNSIKGNITENSEIQRHMDVRFISIKKVGQTNKNKTKKAGKTLHKFVRKSPLYDNCWMYAPNGELLCSCDKKKAEWYAVKGLAEVINDEPYTIKLLFEPKKKNRGLYDYEETDYYKQFKQNQCVVCGSQQSFMKFYIVPREYRKHFPCEMKDHKSHDIVLTCTDCHLKAEKHAIVLKQELANICGAPIYVSQSSRAHHHEKVRGYCRTLLKSGQNLPKERRKHIEEIVKEYFQVSFLDADNLEKFASSPVIKERQASDHGRKVVEYFQKNGQGLKELEELWRKNFLDNLEPQFLPHSWCIHHKFNTVK